MSQPLTPQMTDPALSEQIWTRVIQVRTCFGEAMLGCLCRPNASYCTCPLSDRQLIISASWNLPVLPTAAPLCLRDACVSGGLSILATAQSDAQQIGPVCWLAQATSIRWLENFRETPDEGQKHGQDTKLASFSNFFSFFFLPLSFCYSRPALGSHSITPESDQSTIMRLELSV
ncbi:hypothetical protein LY78DRAFT_288454 [Colletotrichum sublineola]|nr:hypothetical protein LY78DRAFT_288454 [Colletotrichum sublineola]